VLVGGGGGEEEEGRCKRKIKKELGCCLSLSLLHFFSSTSLCLLLHRCWFPSASCCSLYPPFPFPAPSEALPSCANLITYSETKQQPSTLYIQE